MYYNYNPKKEILLNHLNYYLSKPNLQMKVVIRSMVSRLKDHNCITEKQFNSVIKFIEREKQFVRMSRSQIRRYFDPLISNNKYSKENNDNGNDLTKFLI